jgi:hypothetical protein
MERLQEVFQVEDEERTLIKKYKYLKYVMTYINPFHIYSTSLRICFPLCGFNEFTDTKSTFVLHNISNSSSNSKKENKSIGLKIKRF